MKVDHGDDYEDGHWWKAVPMSTSVGEMESARDEIHWIKNKEPFDILLLILMEYPS